MQLETASIDPRDFEVDMVHICMDQVFTYVGFRVGGLGYGPRFRCLQPTHGLMVEVGPIWNPPVFQCSDSLRKVSQIVTDSDRYLQSFTAGSVGIGEFKSGVNPLSVSGRP